MSVSLPNGAIFSIAEEYAADEITVTGISNAATAVVSFTGATLKNGDYVELTSGWNRLNDRIFRVENLSGSTFELTGIDTSDTKVYPAGSGVGSLRKIAKFQQVQQVTDLSTSGGDMQFATYSFLENDFESQIPTQSSAMSMTLTIADDPNLPGYKLLKKWSESRNKVATMMRLASGSEILYNSYLSLNETPSFTKGEIMTTQATMSLASLPTRYS